MTTENKRMNYGGYCEGGKLSDAILLRGYTGTKTFQKTTWNKLTAQCWTFDYLNHGSQELIVGKKKIIRTANVAMLYSPATEYREFEKKGQSVDESFLLFTLIGEIHKKLKSITGKSGHCCFLDPGNIIGNNLKKLSEFLFFRAPGYQMFAQSVFAELLGLLDSATLKKPKLREVNAIESVRDDIFSKVCEYIRLNIYKDITVADLATHLMMSESSFAHKYPGIAGETPLQTITRLKIEDAKHLLIGRNYSVKDTSNHLGFSSEFQFSRVFKRIEGISPSNYRMHLIRK